MSSYSDNIVIDMFFILQIYTKDFNKCSDQELAYTLIFGGNNRWYYLSKRCHFKSDIMVLLNFIHRLRG